MILLRDYWDVIGFPQLKKNNKKKQNKREKLHIATHTDICAHKIFKG